MKVKYGLVDGKVFTEGGGVKFESDLSKPIGTGTVTTSGGGQVSGPGGGVASGAKNQQDIIIARLEAEQRAREEAQRQQEIRRQQEILTQQKLAEQQAAQLELKKLQILRERSGVSPEEKVVLAREELRVTAKAEGRGFSRLQAERFIKERAGQRGAATLRRVRPTKQVKEFVGEVREFVKEPVKITDISREQITTSLIPPRDTSRDVIGITGEIQPVGKRSFIGGGVSKITRRKTGPKEPIDPVKIGIESLELFKEKVVVPLRTTIPSLGETPLGVIASDIREAQRIIESKQPGEVVSIGLPGQIREIEVSRLQGKNLVGFGTAIAIGETDTALKDITKTYQEKVVVPLSESKAFKGFEEKVIVPISKFGIEPFRSEVGKGVGLFKEKIVVPLRTTIPSLGETPIGQIAQAKRIIESKQPGEVVSIGLPGQIREIEVSRLQETGLVGFGQEVLLGEVETAFTDIARKTKIGPPEMVGKGVRFGTELLSYTLPGVFVGSVAAKGVEAELGKGVFGGPKSGVQFVIENPLEVGLAGAVGAFSAAKVLKGRKLKKLQEFTKIPEQKLVVLEQKISKEVVKPSIVKPKLSLSQIDDVSRFELGSKVKGRVLSTEFIPESSQFGQVVELRKIGKDPAKVFKGLAELSGKGIYKETINFGKITKITELTKEGKGTIKLFEKGKEIFKQQVKKPKLPDLKFGRPKIDKIIIDRQFSEQGLKIEEIKIVRGRKIKEIKRLTTEAGEIIKTSKLPSLESKLFTGEIKSTTLVGKDVSSGVEQIIIKKGGFLDIISVGERKGLAKLKTSKGSLAIRKKASQTIEFGLDKSVDVSLLTDIGGKKISFKTITPKVSRDITEFSGQKTITKFINLKTPSLKLIQKQGLKTIKTGTQKIKTIDRALAREEFDKLIKKIIEETRVSGGARREIILSKVRSVLPKKPVKLSLAERTLEQLDIPTITYVEPTQTFLRTPTITQPTQAPFIFGMETTRIPTTGLGFVSRTITPIFDVGMDLSTKEITAQTQTPVSELSIVQVSKQTPILKIISSTKSVQKTSQIQKQVSKQVQKQVSKQLQEQQQFKRNEFDFGKIKVPQQPKPKEPIEIIFPPIRFQPIKTKPLTTKPFQVQVRRFGQFKTIASAKDINKAFALGRERVASTLAATFKIQGPSVSFKTPKGFRRKLTKEGTLFIERRGKRLSRRGEVKEIKIAKKLKKRRKKR